MPISVTSISVELIPPNDPKVGQSVTLKGGYAATVSNDEHVPLKVVLYGLLTDGQHQATEKELANKSVGYGSWMLNGTIDVTVTYNAPGSVTLAGTAKVTDGWKNLGEASNSKYFNVLR